MKTKLSLIIVAFIAVCAFAAQSVLKADPAPKVNEGNETAAKVMKRAGAVEMEKILLENGKTYGNGDLLSSENVTVTLGYDYKWKAVSLTSNGLKVEDDVIVGGLAELAQIVEVKNTETGEMEMKPRCVTLVGQNNPTDGGHEGDAYVKGVGYNPEKMNTPNNGTMYTVTTKKSGTVRVGIILNADKDFYVVKSDGSCLTQDEVKLFDQDGEAVSFNTENEEHPYSVATKIYGIAEFEAEADMPYVIFCAGSKLSFMGVTFTPAAAAEPEDISIAPVSGDIYEAFAAAAEGKVVGNISIELKEGASYTFSNTITVPANLSFSGNGATVDASALAGKMFEQPAAAEEITSWADAKKVTVYIDKVNMKGLAKPLFAGSKYFVTQFTLYNSVLELTGDAITFDFSGGSNGIVTDFTITNSTIYAPEATSKSLFSSQSGYKPTEISTDQLQTFNLKNSTFYNLTKSKNFFSHRTNNQAFLVFNVEENIFVNCGKSGQAIKGLNGGGSSANPTWNVSGNAFNFDGADTSAAENTGDEAEPIQNSVAGVVAFTDPAAGDFNGKFAYKTAAPEKLGDPRWTLTFEQAPVDIEVTLADGDIYAALAAAEEGIEKIDNITINLVEGASYTISNSIVAPADVTVNGNGATIDADALENPIITLASAELTEWTEANVSISGVTINNLKKAVFYSPGKNYYGDFTLDNSVIHVAADVIVFDWTKGSVAKNFTISNSTIYAPTATTKFLYSSQGGQKVTEYNADQLQSIILKNSTFYNLTYSKSFFNHRQNNQAFFVFDLEDNVFVNCGKKGQVVKGVNNGQSGKNPTWIIKGNVFNFDGADTSAEESTGDADEPVQNSVAGVVTFTDAPAGNFNGNLVMSFGEKAPASAPGDPRWTLAIEETNEIAIWESEEPVAADWSSDAIKALPEKLAQAKVGDKIHVKINVPSPTPDNNWSAQVAIKQAETWKDLEAGVPVGDGSYSEAVFVLTGDILRMIQESGLQMSGNGYTTQLVTLERTELTGSDASIWVGQADGAVTVNQNHFINGNVKAGNIIRVSATKASDDAWIVLQYSGEDTGWSWTDYGVNPAATETGFDVIVTEEMIPHLTTDGIIFNQSGYTLTQVELIQPEDIVVDVESGDIAQAVADASAGKLVKGITINLKKDVAYTISAPVVSNAGIIVNGNGATVDASAVDGDLFQLSAAPAVDAVNDYFRVESIKIADVTITGIKRSIIYDNNSKYCVVDLTIDNCVFGLATEKVSNDALISFQGGGVKDFTIKNSTVYGNAVAKYFIRYNNSARLDRYGFDTTTDFQTMTYLNNTFYKVIQDGGQWGNYNGINGQVYSKFDVQKNIWVDCSTDIIRRMAGGRFNGNNPMTFAYNTYYYNGEDRSASEASYDKSETILTTNPGFKDADNADFALAAQSDQAKNQTGDPRWGTYEAFTINVVAENCEVIVTPYAAEGTKVYVDVKPAEGYEVSGGTVVNDTTGEEIQVMVEGDGDNEKHYFIMPASNVTVTMTVVKLAKITLNETTNGQVTVVSVNMQDDPYAESGKKICMMAKPDEGYEVQSVVVKDAADADVEVIQESGVDHGQDYNYYFIMPESDVTITITFAVIDSIEGINAAEMNDGKWYNLQGVEVEKPAKGIFIHNGKKVIVK